ncbi:hypothetical protein FACS189443_1940 [Planctomycetales bacterium]|nr:hypothetical protein FACS189443_1940 [Planctomycetales bacterium]
MKKNFRASIFLSTLLIAGSFAVAANPTPEQIDEALVDAKTVEDVVLYQQNTLSAWRQNVVKQVANDRSVSEDDAVKLLREEAGREIVSQVQRDINQFRVAAGKRILLLAKTDEDKAKGSQFVESGLRGLVRWAELAKDEKQELKYRQELDKVSSRSTSARPVSGGGQTVPPVLVEYNKFAREEVYPLRKDFAIDKFNEAVAELKVWAAKKDLPRPERPLLLAVDIASQPAAAKLDPQLAGKTIKDILEFVESDQFDHPEAVKKSTVEAIEKNARRLLGADLKLYGKNVDGSDFDWASLRGKYVIVKFTATWCGPCRGEIPGLISAYEKYHDKGLEIVSVYVWERGNDDNDKLNDDIKEFARKEKIDWRIISEPLTLKAGGQKIGEFYGVQSVPTMLLIDKDGKIIDTAARGQHLQDRLAEIF